MNAPKKNAGKKIKPRLLPRENVIAVVNEAAAPICEIEGMELVHIEYQREATGWVLRIYIDRPGGVVLDDCARISRQLSDILDVSLENTGPYHLEVSSPGPERPLGKEKDYERFRGHTARVRTSKPINGQKNFKGTLAGMADGFVKLLVGEKMVAIPYREVTRARLVNYNGDN